MFSCDFYRARIGDTPKKAPEKLWLCVDIFGPWTVIDDVDSSLHPMVTRFIVSLFHDPILSKKDAQLWITTHDTSLLDTDLMRRDQFWFVDKDELQGSILVPLTDFSPRKNEALERGYLRGRYGGLPFISSLRH